MNKAPMLFILTHWRFAFDHIETIEYPRAFTDPSEKMGSRISWKVLTPILLPRVIAWIMAFIPPKSPVTGDLELRTKVLYSLDER